MRTRRIHPSSDRGESLIEMLVAIVILGIAAVAILAGLSLAVKSSAMGRTQATGGTYVRSVAEAIQSYVAASPSHYKPCAGANAYIGAAAPTTVGEVDHYSAVATFDLPHGYTVAQAKAQRWTPSVTAAPWQTSPSSCSDDGGSQRIDLTVTSSGTGVDQAVEQLTLIVRNPCTGPADSPC
ncbi:type IV pilus modification PilV family protein [Nocardioides sp. URHA0032]|uniref:type IV pilus modification PilV family protein n=1 Tax=Nocardioides sp. URHA0032 TaxID=1380388 RepID=UPI00048CDFDE|nr:type II secretion system protein [Nocardioides sp. URHA0032]